jgi:hypothetical protein
MKKLLIIPALILFALFFVHAAPVYAADSGQQLLLQKSFPTQSGDRLKVNAYAGNVKINCWGSNEIMIKIYGTSDAVKYLDFDVTSDELGINISATKKAEFENITDLGLRYEICVPRNYCVKVSGGKNVTVDKKYGPVEISNR